MLRLTGLIVAPILLSLVVGCTPAHIIAPDPPSEGETVASILLYRNINLNAGGIPLVFGAEGTDWLQLKSDEYTELRLQPRTYLFFVRSTQADKSFTLQVTLNPGDHKCIRAYPNAMNYLKALTIVGYHFGNTFKIEESDCPDSDRLAPYRKVETQSVRE